MKLNDYLEDAKKKHEKINTSPDKNEDHDKYDSSKNLISMEKSSEKENSFIES